MKKPSRFLPYSKQNIDETDIASVTTVLKSDYITQGPLQAGFEEAVANYCGARFGTLFPNGSIALQMAALAAGLQQEDYILTSPVTFVASANAALYCGAGVRFADIDPETFNIDLDNVQRTLDSDIKAVIPVDFAGMPVDLAALRKIVGEEVFIIADSCHALGADYRHPDGQWSKVGDCEFADMAVFSFHPTKNITTGEGGIVLTNREELYRRLKLLQANGLTREPDAWENRSQAFTTTDSGKRIPNPWYYEMKLLGQNCRLTEMQCALGLSQLTKLDRFVARRREISEYYRKRLEDTPINFQQVTNSARSGCHLFVIQIDFKIHGVARAELMPSLREVGIGTQVHYIPVHYQPYYQQLGFKPGMLPRSESYYEKALSIPLFSDLDSEEAAYVIDTLFQLLGF